jgi:eukaryotic-like serine/threonine-protein kinase
VSTGEVADPDPLIGQAVGNYRILSPIGRGGMGSVYLGVHEVLGRHAAVKVLLPEYTGSVELVARFFKEARATAQLRHGAFVEIFDSGRLGDGSAYLVMEYLRGESLAAYLQRVGRLPVDDALAIARDIAEGVGVAHSHGVIHRDLKPDNVYLAVASGERDQHGRGSEAGAVTVKVLDFGIAKLTGEVDSRAAAVQTRTGAVLGTPIYMAPEQCRGAGAIDHRADVYALGCIVHEMLTGLPPFPLDGFGEIISAHLFQAPPPLRTLRAEVPEDVETLVLSMLGKKPGDRPPDMAAVAMAIDSIRSALAYYGGVQAGAGSVAQLAVHAPKIPSGDWAPMVPAMPPYPSPYPASPRTPRPPSNLPGSALPTEQGRTPPPPVAVLPPSWTPAPSAGGSERVQSAGGTKLLGRDDHADARDGDGPAPGSSPGGRRRRAQPGMSGSRSSTLRGATGELSYPGLARPRGRSTLVIATVVVATMGVGALVVALSMGSSQSRSDKRDREHALAQETDESSTVAVRTPPPPAPTLEVEPPPRRAADRTPPPAEDDRAAGTVNVRIASDPPGAAVIDPRTGAQLGRTPFAREMARAPGGMRLSLRKNGYRNKDLSLSLAEDVDLHVALDRKPTAQPKPDDDDDRRKL